MKILLKMWDRLEETIAIVLFSIMIFLGLCQILSRFGVFHFALDWTEELSRYAFITLVYVAASLAIARKRHVRVEIIDMILPSFLRRPMALFVNVCWIAFNLAIANAGWEFASAAIGTTTPVMEWDQGYLFMIIPVTFVLMSLRLAFRTIQDFNAAEIESDSGGGVV